MQEARGTGKEEGGGLQEARGTGEEEGNGGGGGRKRRGKREEDGGRGGPGGRRREQVACGNVIVGKAGPAVTHASTRGIGPRISKEKGCG